MTSTTSLNKNFFSLICDTLRRYKLWPILSLVLSLLVTVLSCQSRFRAYDPSYFIDNDNYTTFFTYDFCPLYFFGMCALLFLATINLYKMTYSKRASDLYFAIPVRRKTTFLVNYIYTAICSLCAFVVGTVVPIVWFLSIKDKYPTSSFDIKYFVTKMILMFFCIMAIVSVLFLCAVASGRKWQYILFSFIFLLGFAVIPSGIIYFLRTTFVAIRISTPKVLNLISPFSIVVGADIINVRYRYCILALIILSALAFVLGSIIFSKRKAECAEQAFASKTVLIIAIAFCTLIAFFQMNNVSNGEKGVQIFGLAVAFVVGYVVSMLLQKKLFSKEAIITVSVATACCAVFYFVSMAAASNIPYLTITKDEVESVSVNMHEDEYLSTAGLLSSALFNPQYYGNDYTTTGVFETNKEITFKKDESLDIITNYYNSLSTNQNYYNSTKATFKFKLKNGKTVTREYACENDYDGDAYLNKLVSLPEYLEQLNYFQAKSKNIVGYMIANYKDTVYNSVDSNTYDGFLTTVKNDIVTTKGNYNDFSDENYDGSEYYAVLFYKTDKTTSSDLKTIEGLIKKADEVSNPDLQSYENAGKIIIYKQRISNKCLSSMEKEYKFSVSVE